VREILFENVIHAILPSDCGCALVKTTSTDSQDRTFGQFCQNGQIVVRMTAFGETKGSDFPS
jgi:hypothetical protein